ncbi:MAG: hypothetical protein PHE88_05410 [Elusimicrobia bacterium]|nr:hypothetical protein [Elusimicrobiota bacterium]
MEKITKYIFWIPRILAIIFILFLAMFSLDIFEGNYGFWGTIAGLFMHNIPTIVLAVVLLISWKHEIVGGIIFIVAGVLYMASLAINMFMHPPFKWYFFIWSLTIAGPSFLIGALFLIGWSKKKKLQK